MVSLCKKGGELKPRKHLRGGSKLIDFKLAQEELLALFLLV